MPIVFRSPDERNEYIAGQKAAVEAIIIHEANRIENLIDKRRDLGPYGHLYNLDDIADELGVDTYDTAEDFLAALDDIHTVEPPC